MDDLDGRVDPLASFVDAGVRAVRAYDGFRGHSHIGSLLDDGFEGEANGGAASFEKPGGVGAAVDRGIILEAVVLGNISRAAPVKKLQLNPFTFRMVADHAFASVASEGRARFRHRTDARFVLKAFCVFSKRFAHTFRSLRGLKAPRVKR